MRRDVLGRGAIAAIAAAMAGCLSPNTVECGDGRVCPHGTLCDDEHATCIDPRGLDLPMGMIDFAGVTCGGSVVITVHMRNYGLSPVEFDAHTTVVGVSVDPPSGTVPPGGEVELAVTASVQAQTAPGIMLGGALVVSTSYELIDRPIRVLTFGALVDATQHIIDFGETSPTTTVPGTIKLTNQGNVVATVSAVQITSAAGAPAFDLPTPFTPIVLQPETSADLPIEFVAPAVNGDSAAMAALTISGPQCRIAPPLTLSGRTTGDAVTFNHTVLDFGTAACGANASGLNVVVTNRSALIQTLTLSDVSPDFVAALPNGNSIAPGGTQQVSVTRNSIPVGHPVGRRMKDLSITATDTALQMLTKPVSLLQLINAPILTASNSNLNLGTVAKGCLVEFVVTISNTGNADAAVTARAVSGMANVTVNPNAFVVPKDGMVDVLVDVIAPNVVGPISPTQWVFDSPGQCSTPPTLMISGAVANNMFCLVQ